MAAAIGLVEFSSISRGIYGADQMVKISEVKLVTAQTICPGKYIVLVQGEVSAVQDSVRAGEAAAAEYLVDSFIIPNVHEDVFPAISGAASPERLGAVGIFETFSAAAVISAADEILKAADLSAMEIRLGAGLGGRACFTFTGDVASVKAGVAAGLEAAGERGLVVNAEVIPAPSDKLREFLL